MALTTSVSQPRPRGKAGAAIDIITKLLESFIGGFIIGCIQRMTLLSLNLQCQRSERRK